MKKVWLSVVIAVAFTTVIAGSAVAEEINAYMGLSPENNKKVVDLVREKTGIQINQTFQSFGEIEAKVKSEAPNFNADMVTGCGSPLAFMAKKNSWTVPFVSAGWKGISDVYADPQGHWFNIANFSFVLVGNKDNLKKKGLKMPTSWKDLTDPKWKGDIVMPSPLSSGTANMMRFTFLALYGDVEGWKYMQALDKNIHYYTRSGNAPTDLVGRGEFTLGITSDENVKARIDKGYPLIWSIPKEGTGYDGTFAFILKGTKKLDTAKKVIFFLGSQEMSNLLGSIGYLTPRPSQNALYGKTPPKYIKIDLAKAAEERPKNNDIWKTKFRTEFK